MTTLNALFLFAICSLPVLTDAAEVAQSKVEEPNSPPPSDKPIIKAADQLLNQKTPSGQTLLARLQANGIPTDKIVKAFTYFAQNKSEFKNQDKIVFVDFSKKTSLSDRRFYVVNLHTGNVTRTQVSHGLGSDPRLNGHASRFSNKNGSNASALGFYKTLQTYTGEYGLSLKLKGLSSINRNSYSREIVVHGYAIGPNYDRDKCYREKIAAGRPGSQKYCLAEGALTRGCFGIPRESTRSLIKQIKGGALLYAFASE